LNPLTQGLGTAGGTLEFDALGCQVRYNKNCTVNNRKDWSDDQPKGPEARTSTPTLVIMVLNKDIQLQLRPQCQCF